MAGYPHGSGYPPYGAPPANPYGAPPANPYAPVPAPYGTAAAPSAPYAPGGPAPGPGKPGKDHGLQGGYHGGPPVAQPYAGAGGYPPAAAAPMPAFTPFAALVPSQFPPGTDPSLVACFQAADQDGSGMIDDKELQRALSSYNQSFSIRTVHLLMYLFTGTNVRRIGESQRPT